MKKIFINTSKPIDAATLEALREMISAAEGRATARTITPDTIIDALRRAEDRMLNIPKTRMIGVKLHADPNAQRFPGAYKYRPESTHFNAEYTKSGWWITAIERQTCKPGATTELALTDAAKDAILTACAKF